MKNTRQSYFSCEFSVFSMSSVCREGSPQYFQQKDKPIQTCLLIPIYGYSTQSLSVHLSWMLAHILFNTPSIAIQRKAGTPQEVFLLFRIGCLANATRAICR